MAASGNITQLLVDYREGKREALDALLPLVYQELRRIAGCYLARERRDHTLQPTALVHEAYLRLINQHSVDWQNRACFYGLAAQMMRRILVNHAENKKAEKNGGKLEKVLFDEMTIAFESHDLDLLALDEALNKLERMDKQKSRIVELKFFGGLTTAEIAALIKISTATVEREWTFARTWLYKTLVKM